MNIQELRRIIKEEVGKQLLSENARRVAHALSKSAESASNILAKDLGIALSSEKMQSFRGLLQKHIEAALRSLVKQ